MSKFAVTLIGVLAVTASLAAASAVTFPDTQSRLLQQQKEPAAASSTVYLRKQPKPDHVARLSEPKEQQSGAGDESGGGGETGSAGLLDVLGLPKKVIGTVASFVLGKLKGLDVKKVLKIAVVGGLIVVVGALGAVAVTGLLSVVSAVVAVLPYIRFFFGGNGGGASESHLDTVTDFVMSAFDKYADKA